MVQQHLYWIDGQIRRGRYPNAKSIARDLGVTERTAYNYRDYMIDKLKAPLKTDRRRGGWYYTDHIFVLPFLALSDAETETLRLSLQSALEYLSPADADAIQHLIGLLQPYLPPLGHPASESLGGAVELAPGVVASKTLVSDCRRAIHDRHRLHILYDGAHRGEVTDRIVQPYHLHNELAEPFLIGWCEMREEMRMFSLGRIREYEALMPVYAFETDPNFDVQEFLGQGFATMHGEELVTVCVRFSPYQARWIRERRYHPSQVNEWMPDESLLVTMRVAGTSEIRRWLLGYGSEVEVLEPASLRDEISQELRKMQKIYAGLPD